MKSSPFMAGMLALLVSGSALAGDWLPTASLRIEFGGNAGSGHFAANLGSAWLEPLAGISRPLPLMNVGYDSRNGASGMLLGQPLRPRALVLRQQEETVVTETVEQESSIWSSTWLWVAVGAAVVAGTSIDVSKEEHGDETSNNGNSGEVNGCNVLSGGDLIGPRPITVLGPDCPGVGNIQLPPINPV